MSAICYCGRPECPVVESIHPDKCHAFEVDDLRAQRDALAEALEHTLNDSTDRDARVRARAALAKVTP